MKIDVQWYGIAYAVGLLLGLMNAKIITKKKIFLRVKCLMTFSFGLF